MTNIEKTYKQKSLHDHILTMPDTYIGSIDADQKEMWIYSTDTHKIIKKTINYVPGFYKIFDEILVNARDHTIRDKTCDTIKFTINKDLGEISVWNNGSGIPIVVHKEYGVYIPELIFGHLLTSSNYDQKGKIVGGKNGYGSKVVNIYSKRFVVETVDSTEKKKYYQEFSENMKVKNPPIIEKNKGSSYTHITYKPDYVKFGLKGLTDDLIGLIMKRIYDLVICTEGINIYLNGEKLKCACFEDYIKMYYNTPPNLVYEKINERWKVGIVYDNDAGFNHISFVNGIWTYQGGTHVTYITSQVSNGIIDHIKQKYKNLKIKSTQIKDNITLFINCVIEDPSFNSQTKEYLTTKTSNYGDSDNAKCILSQGFLNKLIKTGIVDEIVNYAQFKEIEELKKTDGKKTESVKGIKKLCDAFLAGSKKSKDTRLILTEGDSAKNFAIRGLEVIGKDYYGVFPLKGKLLNVRNASIYQLKHNEEFINIKKILGLKQGEVYTDISKLRYGGIIILADQDDDGTHIRGLILNLIEHYWPSLLSNITNFVQTMSTPIIKAYKKNDAKKKNPMVFYNRSVYDNWIKDELSGNTNGWYIKYYKGLGTSSKEEAKEVFKQFANRVTTFKWEKNDETITDSEENTTANVSHESLLLAFDKKYADKRKQWLRNYNRNLYLPYDKPDIPISEFINKDLIHYSNINNIRSIPSLLDGLKPSQRKILYAGFKRSENAQEIKVAQFAAYIAQHTEYHHGEDSLCKAIIGMAQNFVGSNNINLFAPNGEFGSRYQGPDSHAAPRYIYTQMEKITPKLFVRADENVLEYLEEDGNIIEPVSYVPILPMVLINGCNGIGTGYSTTIYPYNPLDVVKNMLHLIKEEPFEEINPWFKGFKGTVEKINDIKYTIKGKYTIDSNIVYISELPVYETIEDYQIYLESKTSTKDDSNKIESYVNKSGADSVCFEVTFKGNELQKLIKNDSLEKFLKLSTTISLSNLYLFNSKGIITKYDYIEDIFTEFYIHRLQLYQKRKDFLLGQIMSELEILKYKVKFIQDILNKNIIIERKKEQIILEKLGELKYPKLGAKQNYDYLIKIPLFSLTQDKIDELQSEYDKKEEEYNTCYNTTIEVMWINEIDEFTKLYTTLATEPVKKKK